MSFSSSYFLFCCFISTRQWNETRCLLILKGKFSLTTERKYFFFLIRELDSQTSISYFSIFFARSVSPTTRLPSVYIQNEKLFNFNSSFSTFLHHQLNCRQLCLPKFTFIFHRVKLFHKHVDPFSADYTEMKIQFCYCFIREKKKI
jgi:hypothetical protein